MNLKLLVVVYIVLTFLFLWRLDHPVQCQNGVDIQAALNSGGLSIDK